LREAGPHHRVIIHHQDLLRRRDILWRVHFFGEFAFNRLT
jgi:hypothetical protein